ncbi:MAG: TetR/AcrR family transcriptional regulator [Mycobacterium sp.]
MSAESRTGERPRAGTKGMAREERERLIVEVATRQFVTVGPSAASLTAIARDAGVSKAMIYAYFSGRDELLIACLNCAGDNLTRAVGDAQQTVHPPGDQALRTLVALVRAMENHRYDWDLLHLTGLPEGAPQDTALGYRKVLNQYGFEGIAGAFASGGDFDGTDAALTMAIWSSVLSGVTGWWRRHPEVGVVDISERLTGIIGAIRRM